MIFLKAFLFSLMASAQNSTYIQGPTLIESLSSVTSSGGTTALLVSSNTNIRLTGTMGHTFTMPDATTLKVGRRFRFTNQSTVNLIVQNSTLTLNRIVRPDHAISLLLQDNSSAGGIWIIQAQGGQETDGQLLYGFNNGAYASSSNLYWDQTNSRLGIGTLIPTVPLDVNGAARIRGLSIAGPVLTDASGNLSSEARLALSRFATGTANTVLTGNGASDSSYGFIVNANIDGAAAIARTKIASGTAHGIIVNNGSGVLSELGPLTNGQILIGSTSATAVPATITGTTNQISVTNGAGSITLATPQNIHTGATPTFGGLTITGATSFPDVNVSTSGDIDTMLNTSSGVRLTGTTVSLRGITSGANGQMIFIRNVTGGNALIINENGSVTAANRILTGTGADLTVANDASVIARYDSTTSRWAIVGGAGGGGGAGGKRTQTGTFPSPVSISAGTGIDATAMPTVADFGVIYITGNGGVIDVTANPQIYGCSLSGDAGKELRVIGTSDTNTVIFENGTGLRLNGLIELGANDTLDLQCLGTSGWLETGRN